MDISLPEAFLPLYARDSRYRIAVGGRGGKSMTVAAVHIEAIQGRRSAVVSTRTRYRNRYTP